MCPDLRPSHSCTQKQCAQTKIEMVHAQSEPISWFCLHRAWLSGWCFSVGKLCPSCTRKHFPSCVAVVRHTAKLGEQKHLHVDFVRCKFYFYLIEDSPSLSSRKNSHRTKMTVHLTLRWQSCRPLLTPFNSWHYSYQHMLLMNWELLGRAAAVMDSLSNCGLTEALTLSDNFAALCN